MTHEDGGFAGLAELVVALLMLGLFLPLVGVGLDNTWQLFTIVSGGATASTDGIILLAGAESELQGAQPLAYCATPTSSSTAGPGAPIEVPVSMCASTALGPAPPNGDADWSTYVSPLPDPSSESCGPAALGAGAVVAATATCIGFFSYDSEASGSPATMFGALSDAGPFTPPELNYLWRCVGSCAGPGGTAGLWFTTYTPSGGYTNAGCPSPLVACNDPDWSTATVTAQFLGTLASSTDPLLSYRDNTGSVVPENAYDTPPSVAALALPTVELVSIDSRVSVPGGATSSSFTSVALTGNVYQSATDGNG